MAFSDDDLKRLKEAVENVDDHRPSNGGLFVSNQSKPMLRGLLSRLETAEKALDWGFSLARRVEDFESTAASRFLEEYEAWRKAAGK